MEPKSLIKSIVKLKIRRLGDSCKGSYWGYEIDFRGFK